MGLINYYRRFIPNFAAITAPLTDLTRKGQPNRVQWTPACQQALETVQTLLTSDPILRLPDFERPFILRTDASDKGLGAVLLQEFEDGKFPITYISRKLLDRERNYAAIEKEGLAMVWAVKKLERFLYGNHFILETDHKPLIFINDSKMKNGRIMRWSLALQPYRFTIRSIKGKENVGADLMSRCPV